jgi:two-component system, NtrC family, response regulator AtoC
VSSSGNRPEPGDQREKRATSAPLDEARERSKAAGFELVVLLSAKVATYPLPASGSVSIGRSEENDIRIDHASVSRRHALLHVGPPLQIEDLGSANGIRMLDVIDHPNTAQIRDVKGQSGALVPVRIGDTIGLGAAVLVLNVSEPAPREADPGKALEDGFYVGDKAMRELHALAARLAEGMISVLLLGETGVGKEVLAEVIHRRSPRRDAPFLRLNCAALSESLLESELFGHEKGAFTGAAQTKAGLFESASGGTVFLDEVGELPMSIQVKLLRVLEDRKVTRVGGLAPRPVDVRFVAATNRDLEAEVKKGTFRQDLFYRLDGISLTIPPLRARVSEIVPIAWTFAARASARLGRATPAFSREAEDALKAHPWPGNVRELRNVVERAVMLSERGEILPQHLLLTPARESIPEVRITPAAPPAQASADLRGELDALERQRILDALESHAGNQTQAAAALGMSRRTFVTRLDAYQIPRPRKR